MVNMRNRIYKAIKSNGKSLCTKDLLGNDLDLCKKWVECQMTPGMNWGKSRIDHVNPTVFFDVFSSEEL